MRGTLVRALDDLLRMPTNDDMGAQLWKISDDKPGLICTVLEWCTSLYRPGVARVYVAATVFRTWSKFDVDITGTILDFLDTNPPSEASRKRLVYHLVSELVRSGHFPVPRYIQWLIARGGLHYPSETDVDGPCLKRLLVELPVHSLSGSMKSHRETLLRRASYFVEQETADIEMAMKCIKHAFAMRLEDGDPLQWRKPMSITKLAQRIKLSSHALQSEICFWLVNELVWSLNANFQHRKESLELPADKFESIRTLLEAAEDFAMLEQFLKLVSQSSNAEVLGQCADTISLHLPIFAAMGAAKSLFQCLYDRLKAVGEEQGLGVRPLLASLANLAPRIPGLEPMAAQLSRELTRTDRSNAVDASSPLSDNMAVQLQDDETGLTEQIEKLASFTSADRPTMERLFSAIVHKYESCWYKEDERQRPYCMLLTRLRVFDSQYFDMMMGAWVNRIRRLTDRPPIARFLPLLITFGCISLSLVFSVVAKSQAQGNQPQPSVVSVATIYMQELLKMLMVPLTPNPVMTSEDCYRFRIVQERARLEHAREVMLLIRWALAEYSASRNNLHLCVPQPLEENDTIERLLELLRDLVLVDSDAACQTLSVNSPDPKLAALIEELTTRLLIPHSVDGQKSFEQVLELANEFTLPFCQVKLSLNLANDAAGGPEGAEKLQSQLELLSTAMDNALDANNIMWTGMISRIGPEITQHLRIRAEQRFLALLPSLRNQQSTHASEEALDRDYRMAENLLAVIDSAVRGAPQLSPSSSSPSSRPVLFTSAMVDRLADIWEILAAAPDGEHATLQADVLTRWLPLVLDYLALLASVYTASAADTTSSTGTITPTASATAASAAAAATNKAGVGPSGAGGEARGRVLLVLAGLMQELDGQQYYVPPSSTSASAPAPASTADATTNWDPGPTLFTALNSDPSLTTDYTWHKKRQRRLGQQAFDIALLLADGLPEDTRQLCARAVRDATSDPRLRYLFSFERPPAAEGLLMLAHRATGADPRSSSRPNNGNGNHHPSAMGMGMGMGMGPGMMMMAPPPEKLSPFLFRRWEILSEPTPNVGENDTSLSLTLFDTRKI